MTSDTNGETRVCQFAYCAHERWKCEGCGVVATVNNAEAASAFGFLYQVLADAIRRSPFDVAPCRVCGEPVVCLPDGLPCCETCWNKVEAEQ